MNGQRLAAGALATNIRLDTVQRPAALRTERVLARARVFLSAASFAAIYLDPTEPSRYASVAYLLLLLYLTGSTAFMLALRHRRRAASWIPYAAHTVDIIWLMALTSLTGASSSPLFPFFTFVVLAAAFRWGFVETMATAALVSIVLCAQALSVRAWPGLLYDGTAAQFELNRFLVRTAYMLIAGGLLAYLASHQKRLETETSAVARLLTQLRFERSLRSGVHHAAAELVAIFGADSLAIAVQETTTGRAALWLLAKADAAGVRRLPLPRRDVQAYLFPAPAAFVVAKRRSRTRMPIALDAAGSDTLAGDLPGPCLPSLQFGHALAVWTEVPNEWMARIFVLNPRRSLSARQGLSLLQRIVANTAPAVHSLYLVAGLRARAGAAERARLARDLHDTSIQSLIALEMELLALGRRTGDPALRSEINDVQSRLRTEIKSLRRLMVAMQPRDVAAEGLTGRLAMVLAQFEAETRIRARFISPVAVSLPPAVHHEIVRIVEASLANVQQHSAATSVEVSLRPDGDGWRLIVEDDGIGFAAHGRTEQRRAPSAPRTIVERVSALGGQVVVRRSGSAGVRMEIRLPVLALQL